MKKAILAAILIGLPVLAADDTKPLPQDAQIKMLKAQRSMQSLQIEMAQLQAQFDKDATTLKQLQTDLVSDCATATKAAGLDPDKFTCDLNAMTIVAKQEPKAESPAKKP